jgi:hypothetical protein
VRVDLSRGVMFVMLMNCGCTELFAFELDLLGFRDSSMPSWERFLGYASVREVSD